MTQKANEITLGRFFKSSFYRYIWNCKYLHVFTKAEYYHISHKIEHTYVNSVTLFSTILNEHIKAEWPFHWGPLISSKSSSLVSSHETSTVSGSSVTSPSPLQNVHGQNMQGVKEFFYSVICQSCRGLVGAGGVSVFIVAISHEDLKTKISWLTNYILDLYIEIKCATT